MKGLYPILQLATLLTLIQCYNLASAVALLPCGSARGSVLGRLRLLLNFRLGGIGDGVLGPPAGLMMNL